MIYLGIVLALFLLAQNRSSQNEVIAWAAALVAAAIVTDLLATRAAVAKVHVRRLAPVYGVVGERMPLRYVVENRSRFVPIFGLTIEEDWPQPELEDDQDTPPSEIVRQPVAWVAHLGPGQSTTVTLPVWPRRRGPVALRQIRAATRFPFGSVARIAAFDQPSATLVYPRLFRLTSQLISFLPQLESMAGQSPLKPGGAEEFYGVRPYRKGDSLRVIDWKRSARTGELVVRELTQPRPPRFVIMLDLTALPPLTPTPDGRRGPRDRFLDDADRALLGVVESAVSLAASLVCDAYLHRCDVGLQVAGIRAPVFGPHHSVAHRSAILDALARLDPRDRIEGAPPAATRPTVVVRLGRGAVPRGPDEPWVIGTSEIGRYLREPLPSTIALVARPTVTPEALQRSMRPLRRGDPAQPILTPAGGRADADAPTGTGTGTGEDPGS